MILYRYDYIGGNIFYGVYAVQGKGFFLGWECGAYDKGEFPVNEVLNGGQRVLFADNDQNLNDLLERLKQHTEDCRMDYQLEKDDHRLNFKFAWGMKKIYG